ncbi:MAG: hypothetical protein IPM64_00615 [Phycisphaerales bacterium]|nr:hypothetical protein [Phycisphaerales bacterium]
MPNDPTIPELCDFDCPHAAFPPAETAGICRTMSAVLCGKLAELVNKNAPCEFRRRQADRRNAPRGRGAPRRSAAGDAPPAKPNSARRSRGRGRRP